MPSITLDQALDILKSTKLEDVLKDGNYTLNRFNEIAGAPDYEWGSGTYLYLYVIYGEDGMYINSSGGTYFDLWTADGKIRLFDGQKGYVYEE